MTETKANCNLMATDRYSELRKMKLNDIGLSIDLETPNNCAVGIFSIGIVPFSVETGQVFEEFAFYERADFESVINLASKHGDIGNTMKWWMSQSQEARNEVLGVTGLNPKGQPIYAKLMTQDELIVRAISYMGEIGRCLNTNGRLRPLGNSDLFDVGIFENTIRALNLPMSLLPYDFWNTLDLRTAVYLASICAGVNVKKARLREGTHHKAVDDAVMQAHWFVDSAKALTK